MASPVFVARWNQRAEGIERTFHFYTRPVRSTQRMENETFWKFPKQAAPPPPDDDTLEDDWHDTLEDDWHETRLDSNV